MGTPSSRPYFGDVRDLLEAIYPTCATFLNMAVPDGAEFVIEVFLDPKKEEEKDLFRKLCYAYEDSYDWDTTPLVFHDSPASRIVWRTNGAVARISAFPDGVRHFDEFITEAKSWPNNTVQRTSATPPPLT